MVLRKRGWASEVVKDGDKAVDEFVALRPDLVFIAVDIPTLDGHVAALEMRNPIQGPHSLRIQQRQNRLSRRCSLFSRSSRRSYDAIYRLFN